MSSQHECLLEYNLEDLLSIIDSLNERSFRAQQIWEWIYKKGLVSFEQMSNLPQNLRQMLRDKYKLRASDIKIADTSKDGTCKWLFDLGSNNEVETVYIPETKRGTLCISSQVGCTLNCTFCHTGSQPWVKNLSIAEILSQVLQSKDLLRDWSELQHKITNIVFMGMGEPLLNYENVRDAIKVLLDPNALNFSKRKITLSTSGIVPNMRKCAEELGIQLAVSLHASQDELRNEIVPINKKYPLKELIDTCGYYAEITGGRKITFEYVMLDSVNDSLEHAERLTKLIQGIPAKINLIPFNSWPGAIYKRSPWSQIREFSAYLEERGLEAPVRTPRGEDILAACGQLKSESQKERKALELRKNST